MSDPNPNIRTLLCNLAIIGMEVSLAPIHGLEAYERYLFEGWAWGPANPPAGPLPQASRTTDADSPLTSDFPAVVSWAVRRALHQARLTNSQKLGLIISPFDSASQPDLSSLPEWMLRKWAPGSVDGDHTSILVLNKEDGSVAGLLASVQDLIDRYTCEAVLIVGVDRVARRESAGASSNPASSMDELDSPKVAVLVVQDYDRANQSNRRIYAKIASSTSSIQRQGPHSTAVEIPDLIESALTGAGRKASDLGQLDFVVDQRTATFASDLDQLSTIYGDREAKNPCAVGVTYPLPEWYGPTESILSLVRGALGVSRRVIYGYPPQAFSIQPFKNLPPPFYLPVWSRSWFVNPTHPHRCTGILEKSPSGLASFSILEESPSVSPEAIQLLERSPILLFPLAGEDYSTLSDCLDQLHDQIDSSCELISTSRFWIEDAQAKSFANYALCLLGRNKEETLREIAFARKGLEKTLGQPGEWQTPLGSYLTTSPLGAHNKVAFVYPGAFNSYPGIGKDLLALFPPVFDSFSEVTSDVGQVLCDRYLYPRSSGEWSNDHFQDLECQLSSDSVSMLTSGSGLAVIYTLILQDVFQVKPGFAFGYSLGESSMLYALQVWREGDAGASVLASTPLFQSRLSGAKLAVRDYWRQHLNISTSDKEIPWANYLLMTDPISIKDRIQAMYPFVFLTHVNAPRQVVIAGEPDHCQDLIKQVNAPALRAPFDHVLHCEAMASEFDEISRINSWEIHPLADVKLYSAADYRPLIFDRHAIATSIATALTSTLDFPRLIQRVYGDGARIFIELGAGSNCSKWISETLKQEEHASFSVNRRGTDDTTSLVRLLARLVSHRVPLSLKPLLTSTRIE